MPVIYMIVNGFNKLTPYNMISGIVISLVME